jgi:hypothetical protein
VFRIPEQPGKKERQIILLFVLLGLKLSNDNDKVHTQ